MKFKKPAKDVEDSKKLIAFMKDIYFIPREDGTEIPIGMSIITDDYIGSGIMVFADNVCSKLEEDRGIAPTEPWNLYTFMNLMKSAGFTMHKAAPGSTVVVFENTRDRYLCTACLNDCKYTGTIVDIPIKHTDECFFMPVRMCMTCASKFDKEFRALVDVRPEQPKPEEPKEEPKKAGFWKRLFGKAGK